MAADEDDDVDDDGEDGDFSDASTPDSKAKVAASLAAYVGSMIVDLAGRVLRKGDVWYREEPQKL